MRTFVTCIGLILLLGGCKKTPATTTSEGGKGGNATLTVTPAHHGEFVDTCTVYIKYNTQDAPPGGIYDDSSVCVTVNDTPKATFPGLKNGNYYLLAKGYHSPYTPPYVKGGAKYSITTQSTVNVIVPTYSYLP